MQPLEGVVRHYPWGSRFLLADMRGLTSPTERPEAEMWFGAHESAPSQVSGQSLHEVIAADPQGQLGARIVEKYGAELPFLVKLLAAGEPLSLQAHPSREQAEAGFEAENQAGIAVDAPERNYRDQQHKPEVIIALTEFEAMSGFRPLDKTRELFRALDCASLEHYISLLQPTEEGDEEALRALFTTWITIPVSVRTTLITEIIAAAQRYVESAAVDDWMAHVLRNVIQLNERYPGDVGVLGALLLNHITLSPGQAMFTGAGQLHAYLSGLGVEVMANSDNVLRGGLTSKYVDVPELVRVLNFTTTDDLLISETQGTYSAPVEEFEITRHELKPHEELEVLNDGPVVALCTTGEVSGAQAAEALWIPAESDKRTLVASEQGATVFVVSA